MSYQLIVQPSAEKQVDRLPRAVQRRTVEAFARLQQNPRGPGTVKLTGTRSTYRIRIGDWRAVYEIDDDRRTVFVTIVAHRRGVYR